MVFPEGYVSILNIEETERAIKRVKDIFQEEFKKALPLSRVTSPLFVKSNSGINDDLNGVEAPVSFNVKNLNSAQMEIVQSLAKWKRMALADYGYTEGFGLYTDMNAIRPDDDIDAIHSIYVDQWDWEMVMNAKDRNLDFLKKVVRSIYSAILKTGYQVEKEFPNIKASLKEDITFVHSEDLEKDYPNLTSAEREREAARKYGSIFLIGIGYGNPPHSGRAPDYDDWSTETEKGYHGLNGDIILWDDVRKDSLEISSMGIRVDSSALLRQLDIRSCNERKNLYWHKRLLSGEFPQTIGGGIGQSRLSMFILKKAHIGEVQASVWPDSHKEEAKKKNITLF